MNFYEYQHSYLAQYDTKDAGIIHIWNRIEGTTQLWASFTIRGQTGYIEIFRGKSNPLHTSVRLIAEALGRPLNTLELRIIDLY